MHWKTPITVFIIIIIYQVTIHTLPRLKCI